MPTPPSRLVLALDPGREKTGLALVRPDGSCELREIVPTPEVAARVLELAAAHGLTSVVLGDRTSSGSLAEALLGLAIEQVDEHRSTEVARALFLRLEPARGLARLLPRSLRSPDRPVDDYAAWVLGRRHLGLPDEP